jgi:S1-C subfamily serine protease
LNDNEYRLPEQGRVHLWVRDRGADAAGFGREITDDALVTSARDDSGTMPRGQIQPGDVIRTFGEQKILDPRDLARKLARTPIGSDVALEFYRDGASETAHVTYSQFLGTAVDVLFGRFGFRGLILPRI